MGKVRHRNGSILFRVTQLANGVKTAFLTAVLCCCIIRLLALLPVCPWHGLEEAVDTQPLPCGICQGSLSHQERLRHSPAYECRDACFCCTSQVTGLYHSLTLSMFLHFCKESAGPERLQGLYKPWYGLLLFCGLVVSEVHLEALLPFIIKTSI